jgi:hypothetical protein
MNNPPLKQAVTIRQRFSGDLGDFAQVSLAPARHPA